MQKLSDLVANPSGLDSLSNYIGEVPDAEWLVVLTRNRDSDCLAESNWACAIESLGGEDEEAGVRIDRFGHWACGWWESLSVREGSPKEAAGQSIVDSLADYPVLDDDDYSTREIEEANEIWTNCYDDSDRVEYIRENRSQFEFHDFADMIGCARGKYFAGCADMMLD